MVPKFKKNIKLAPYTTFKIGGAAKYFFTARTKKELIRAIGESKKMKIPVFVLGQGSNLLVADNGFDGLVIKIQNSNFKTKGLEVFAEAGVSLSKVVNESAEKGLSGLGWARGIYGTVGGAIRGNAGAFGGEIKDVIGEVEAYDAKTEKIRAFKVNECCFKYRESIFKKRENLIILSAVFKLKKGEKNKIKKDIKGYLDYRIKNHPLDFPSAGSVFKNPPQKSAGELIEKCGLKGKIIGKAQISSKHANFIINLGGAKADDVLNLINLAKRKVKEKFKIELREEIKYLGF
ncbi:MAG: UDP-N-acetylmuramate dehydrogenase [Candidatus Nealsonbacteria bacterium]|nr:UDP-N-acetylmuramate dehydrogenase [Candidatus Nealsonbacteria bacterium]